MAIETARALRVDLPGTGRELRPAVDLDRVERGIREMLIGLGEDPEREGLVETPARVARAYAELLAGAREDAGEHLARVFSQEQAGEEVVMLRGIRFVSLCEHHLLPFTGVAHVAYLPSHGRVTGLSKLARTVDVFARRLQMQERLTARSRTRWWSTWTRGAWRWWWRRSTRACGCAARGRRTRRC